MPSPGLRRWPLLTFATLSLALSLTLRIWHRGDVVPGWDVLGAAEGLYRWSTESWADLARFYIDHGYYWAFTVWNLYAIPYVLLPGALAAWWPWEWWPHAVTFATAVAIVAVTCRALGLGWRDAGPLLLAWGASATLCSWSVAGLAVSSAALPHALALAIVLRLGRRPVASALGWLGVHLLSWHVQDLGQTVFVVFLAGALLKRDATRGARVVWLLGGIVQLWSVLAYPTQARFREVGWPGVGGLVATLVVLGRQTLVEQRIDLPAVLVLGIASLALIRRERVFWWVVVGAQVGLVFMLALKNPTFVWPRRCVLLLAYATMAIAAADRHAGPRVRRALAALLVAANLWQVAATVAWARRPLDPGPRGTVYPLPYTHTSNFDYFTSVELVRWHAMLEQDLQAGRRLFLLLNHGSFTENATNPSGILERLYLALGHDAFADRVVVLGEARRWNRLPIRAPSEAAATVGLIGDPSAWVVYRVVHDRDPPQQIVERSRIETALGERFAFRAVPVGAGSHLGAFRIDRLDLQPKPR